MPDGRMIEVDKSAGAKYTAYEITHGTNTANLVGGCASCSTFNIWNLGYTGYVTYRPPCTGGLQWPNCDDYWTCAGGSGAGTPLIAGLIRPKELVTALAVSLSPADPDYNPDVATGDGLIHHALAFCYLFNRCGPPLYPTAYRNDGSVIPNECDDYSKPVEGMLFQLMDPDNSIEDSISDPYGKVIVRTLKTYGMVLVDGGSNDTSMALYIQNMYTPGGKTNRQWWDDPYAVPCFSGLYNSITGITAANFRVVNTEDVYPVSPRLLWEHSECPEYNYCQSSSGTPGSP